MRKLGICRRGVSTMIAGIIVLSIFLTALSVMVMLGQQNAIYQSNVFIMQHWDVNKHSEDLRAVFPGLSDMAVVGGLSPYVLNVSNYAGIGTRIARLYINSSASPGCFPSACVLDPSWTAAPYTFMASDDFVNPGEYGHNILLWLPSTITLPKTPGTNTVSIVTSRGNVFLFLYPFPPLGLTGGPGGTGLNIGPLVIRYETVLITYSINNFTSAPSYPLPVDTGWVFPRKTSIIFFVKIANQGLNPVTLLPQSVLQIQQFGDPGNPNNFWIAAPMDTNLCLTKFQKPPFNTNTYCSAGGAYSGGNTDPSKTVQSYSSVTNPYIIPSPPQPGVCCGPPVYVLFSLTEQAAPNQITVSSQQGTQNIYYSYLNLVFQYDDGSGTYNWGVNLPFVIFCAGPAAQNGQPYYVTQYNSPNSCPSFYPKP